MDLDKQVEEDIARDQAQIVHSQNERDKKIAEDKIKAKERANKI